MICLNRFPYYGLFRSFRKNSQVRISRKNHDNPQSVILVKDRKGSKKTNIEKAIEKDFS